MMGDSLAEAAYWAVLHFKHMDEANAAIHCAPVRYSPITFRLAGALIEGIKDERVYIEAREVVAHVGQYEQDKGR